ncbi:hypothetical protein NV379_23240 [Paenibacillus sp. N1-5-1-14]|uniref:hypothetical protein n=1 Tax=Paenibacillus radicibacter TaxID=2972488 RepID=UPI00215927AD|nr:hypothetical protein [Paenibacillus radicibacter]MCR8645557.1 hypothetical protein [Paenibacillus radicibacter]
MPVYTLYGDFHDDQIVPFLLSVQFHTGELNWSTPYLYIPLDTPKHIHTINELDEDVFSISILLSDLTIHSDKPNEIGVDLQHVQARHNNIASTDEITTLLIRLCDIEEVLSSQPTASCEAHTTGTCERQ